MKIYLGSDHGGFVQKNLLKDFLIEKGYEVTDCGTYNDESTDYPDFALAVGKAVAANPSYRGILLCRSGEGMEMAANKIPKIRAALVWNQKVAAETRHDNDANILVLPSDFITNDQVMQLTDIFLETAFSHEDRHIRRLEKLHNIEHSRYES